MEITLRTLQANDTEFLSTAMIELQQYLVPLDPERRLTCPAGYGDAYVKTLFDRISQGQGRITIATCGEESVGMIAGIIRTPETQDALGSTITLDGEVIELVVLEKYRNLQIGRRLMQDMEHYFAEAGCQTVSVQVFVPNSVARSFYNSLGYTDRMVCCVKPLPQPTTAPVSPLPPR